MSVKHRESSRADPGSRDPSPLGLVYNALDLVQYALDPVGPQPGGSSIVSLVRLVQYHPVVLTDYGNLSTSPGRMAEAHKMQHCSSTVDTVLVSHRATTIDI